MTQKKFLDGNKNLQELVKQAKEKYNIESLSSEQRLHMIAELAEKNINDTGEHIILSELIILESESVLSKKGKIFKVKSKSNNNQQFNLGACYNNAAKMMQEGYGYVEGYIKHKRNKLKTAHAWNVDSHGKHFDFTIKDSIDFNYYGVEIPTKKVFMVGLERGGVWFAVLPFLKNDENLD